MKSSFPIILMLLSYYGSSQTSNGDGEIMQMKGKCTKRETSISKNRQIGISK